MVRGKKKNINLLAGTHPGVVYGSGKDWPGTGFVYGMLSKKKGFRIIERMMLMGLETVKTGITPDRLKIIKQQLMEPYT